MNLEKSIKNTWAVALAEAQDETIQIFYSEILDKISINETLESIEDIKSELLKINNHFDLIQLTAKLVEIIGEENN